MAHPAEVFADISSEYSTRFRGDVEQWRALRKKNPLDDLTPVSFQLIFRIVTAGLMDCSVDNWSFDCMDLIGEGGNFQVYQNRMGADSIFKHTRLQDEPLIAVKRLKAVEKSQMPATNRKEQRKLCSLLREIHVMTSMKDHEEIVGVAGYGYDIVYSQSIYSSHDYAPYIAMEFAPHGTLRSFLSIYQGLPARSPTAQRGGANALEAGIRSSYTKRNYWVRTALCLDVAKGLAALHNHKIFHTDVKADNILVFEPAPGVFKAKLSDFGTAIIVDSNAPDGDRFHLSQDFCNTARYQAPELDENDYMQLNDSELCRCDIFSYGALLYECIVSFIFPNRPSRSPATDLDLRLDEVFAAVESLYSADQAGDDKVCTPRALKDAIERSMLSQADRVDSMEAVLHLCCRKSLYGTKICESKSCGVQDLGFNSNLLEIDLNFLTLADEYFQDFVACVLPLFSIMAPQEGLNILEDLLAASDTAAALPTAAQGRLLFFRGLCHVHGTGVVVDYNLACGTILESARLGYLPAKYTYRRMHEALFSINEGSEIIYHATYSPHALEDIDPQMYRALDEIDRCHSDDYLAASTRLSERDVWTTRCVEAAQHEFLIFSAEQIRSKSHCLRRHRVLEFLEETKLQRLDFSSDLRFCDHMLALAIVLDEPGCGFFASVLAMLPTMTFDRHFSQIATKTSPLMLACRTTQVDAVEWIAAKSSTDFESDDATIPLHFLFLFQNDHVSHFFRLLSHNLDLSRAYHVSSHVVVIEQLTVFEGNPLSFAIQSGNQAAIDCLASVKPFVQDETFQRNFGSWTNSALISTNHSTRTDLWLPHEMVWRIFCMGILRFESYHLFTSDNAESLLNILLDPEKPGVSAQSIGAFWRLWATHQQSLWISHGKALWQDLLEQWKFILMDLALSADLKSGLIENATILIYFGGVHHTLTFAAFAQSFLSEDEYEEVASMIHTQVYLSGVAFRTMSTRLGLVMGKHQDPDTVWPAVMMAVNCSDVSALERVLKKSYVYQIDWHSSQPFPDSVLFELARGPSPYTDALARVLKANPTYTAPKTWKRSVYDTISGFWILSFWKYETIGALNSAIYYKNKDALLALIEYDLVEVTYPRSHINVYHLLCSDDAYADMLSALLARMDPHRTEELLQEGEGWTIFIPIEIAFYGCNCKCMRALLEFYKKSSRARSQLDCFDSGYVESLLWAMQVMKRIAESLKMNSASFEQWHNLATFYCLVNLRLLQTVRFPNSDMVHEDLKQVEVSLKENHLPPLTSLTNGSTIREDGLSKFEPDVLVKVLDITLYAYRKLHFLATLHRRIETWYVVGVVSIGLTTFKFRDMAFHYLRQQYGAT